MLTPGYILLYNYLETHVDPCVFRAHPVILRNSHACFGEFSRFSVETFAVVSHTVSFFASSFDPTRSILLVEYPYEFWILNDVKQSGNSDQITKKKKKTTFIGFCFKTINFESYELRTTGTYMQAWARSS